ncbi:MAG: hypothetical protein ALMCE001_07320 [Methanocorpusculum sp. MCE]|nr:MAG: hypothetical protein ALMCE001_07320 [Methanocorpusculum sp. MCE]
MYQRLIRTCAPEITRSLNCRVFCQDTQEFARSNLAHRFGLTPSLTMPKRKTIINFTFNGEIRQIIPDFQKLNLEHKYDIDIGMTALAGFICIHGFKKRAKMDSRRGRNTSKSSVLPTSERRSPSFS